MNEISAKPYPKQFIEINNKRMAYVAIGSGEPIVFLHGNPTSSFLWRNIMPYVSASHQAIAPDLIGMGDSDKLDNPGANRYSFVEHRKYLNGFLNKIIPDGPVILVVHDWGSALGFDWAYRNADRVGGICFMESIVAPIKHWDHWNEHSRGVFQGLRSAAGEEMILEKNIFVERILPGSIIRKLTQAEMNIYRQPFCEPGESRRPTLSWPRQIPIAGEPKDVHQIVSDYAAWLPQTVFPKLFVNADPGAIMLDHARTFVRSWQNVSEVRVRGSHFIQEDSPHEIGAALADWIKMAR